MAYLQLAAGLAALLVGAELLVRGSVALARRLSVPSLVIGLTVVALGTSAPEFVVSIGAVLGGASGVAVGTVLGSNVANVLLVLGLPAVICATGHRTASVVRDVDLMIGAAVLLLVFAADGVLERWQGAVMFALLLTYLHASYRRARTARKTEALDSQVPATSSSLALAALFVLAGIVALWAGARVLLPAAIDIAQTLGVSDKVIGVVMVAVGTSLPELTTAVVAAVRRHGDVAIGNVVGSNLFNILGALGLTAIIAPIPVGRESLAFDIWIVLGASLLLIPYAMRRATVGRLDGAAFLVLYAAYVTAEFLHVPEHVAAFGWPPW